MHMIASHNSSGGTAASGPRGALTGGTGAAGTGVVGRAGAGGAGAVGAALGFAPSTADSSLFLCTDTSLPPFFVLIYVDDLVFATADTKALTLITRDRARRTTTLTQSQMVHQVLQCFGFLFSSPQPTPLSTGHSLSAPPSDESIEPIGLHQELVSCLSSSCEAEIYAGAMAAQELRWLTYLLTDLGEKPRSPPVLYVDNKAMIALCQEHRLEHRTKQIALRYFLARELQQRGQLRLAYVATRANTADIFTKALPPGDHQRFSTVLGLVPTLPHLLTDDFDCTVIYTYTYMLTLARV
ncbi:unnamed protein product [Closterium sp. NIES-54]